MTVAALMLASVATQGLGIAATRASEGLRRARWVLVAFTAIGVSVLLMARVLALGVPLAVAYGVWSGAGIVLAAAGGALVFGDRLTRTHLAALLLVLAGVVLVYSGK